MTAKEREFSTLINDNQGLIIKVSRLYTNTLEDEEDYEIPTDLKNLDLEGLEEINLDDETLFNLTN